jgi:rubrerythrin
MELLDDGHSDVYIVDENDVLVNENYEQWFRNHYTCPQCGHSWQDTWTATCDDDCPACGKRHISPTHSEDL